MLYGLQHPTWLLPGERACSWVCRIQGECFPGRGPCRCHCHVLLRAGLPSASPELRSLTQEVPCRALQPASGIIRNTSESTWNDSRL